MTHVGAGVFSVVGSVTGNHANASAGTAYTSDAGSNTGANGGGAGLEFTIATASYDVGSTITASVTVGGALSLSNATSYSTSDADDKIRGLALHDIDGDGDLDRTFNRTNIVTSNKLTYQLNNGAGSFGAEVDVASIEQDDLGDQGNTGEFADIDKDGDIDFIGHTESSWDFYTQKWTGSAFGAPVYAADGGPTYDFAVGDLTNDGAAEIVHLGVTGNASVSTNNGSGGFSAWATYTDGAGSGANATELRLADLNDDGYLDAVGIKSSFDATPSQMIVWMNQQNGTFGAASETNIEDDARQMALTDVDNDGDVDVLVAHGGVGDSGQHQLGVIKNSGSGAFGAESLVSYGSAWGTAAGLETGDLDGDGDMDALVSQGFGKYRAMVNDGTGSFAQGSGLEGASATGYRVAFGDIDGDGVLEIVASSHSSNVIGTLETGITRTVTAGAGNSGGSPASLGVRFGASDSENLSITIAGTSASVLGIASLDASTASGAQSAMSSIDNALNSLNTRRTYLGVTQRRLQSMMTTAEQRELALTGAESRIRDLDFADASAALARTKLLENAGVLIAGQTNRMNTALFSKLLRDLAP